jgi:hypothetical protein
MTSLQYLTTQLTADGAACPSDQHHLVGNVFAQQVVIRGNRLTAQQVVDIQFAQI